jgi:hypothetical protein
MYAVLQNHEVVEYYPTEDDAINCIINCIDRGDDTNLYLVKLIKDYSVK